MKYHPLTLHIVSILNVYWYKRRKDATIHGTKEAIKGLEHRLENSIAERNATVEDLEQRLQGSESRVKHLQHLLTKEKEEAESYHLQMQLQLQKINTVEQERASRDKVRNDELTNMVNTLSNLTSSHIQGLYDQCLEQEHILRLEGALPSTGTTSQVAVAVAVATKKSISPGSEPMKHINEKLAHKTESVHLNWETILEDESDRRAIFGNLNNRVQMNLGHLDRHIKRMHGKHSNAMKRAEKLQKKRFNDSCTSYDRRIFALETTAKRRTMELDDLSVDCSDTKRRLKNARSSIESLKSDLTNSNKTIEILEDKLSKATHRIASIQGELEKVSRYNSWTLYGF